MSRRFCMRNAAFHVPFPTETGVLSSRCPLLFHRLYSPLEGIPSVTWISTQTEIANLEVIANQRSTPWTMDNHGEMKGT